MRNHWKKLFLRGKIWLWELNDFAHAHYYAFWLTLFAVARLIIVFMPEPGYTDVTHYYERYANIWHYGNPPYTHWVFEYGPLAALVIYLPLLADLAGVGHYYYNYEFLSFLCEAVMFAGLVWYNERRGERRSLPLLLYIVLTSVAQNWLYQGIDMIFCSLAILSIVILESRWRARKLLSWLFLWASTAVKFLTLPLIAPFYLLLRGKWVESLTTVALSFLLVWGGPLLYYRSSLSVPFIYNGGRTIKYNTITHLILRTANLWTHSEVQSEEAPDYSFSGPMSTTAGHILTVLYPLSLLIILMIQALVIFHAQTGKWWDPAGMWRAFWQPSGLTNRQQTQLAAWCYATYFLVSFFTAKIYSNPFCLWMLPLIVLLDWESESRRRRFYWWLSLWAILELTPFFTASFWHLQSFSWFRYEAFEVTYGWVKWLAVIMTAKQVFHKPFVFRL